MTTRVCTKCLRKQDLDVCFYKTNRREFKEHGGYKLVCKTCVKEYAVERRFKVSNSTKYTKFKQAKRIKPKDGDEYKVYDFNLGKATTRIYYGRQTKDKKERRTKRRS